MDLDAASSGAAIAMSDVTASDEDSVDSAESELKWGEVDY